MLKTVSKSEEHNHAGQSENLLYNKMMKDMEKIVLEKPFDPVSIAKNEILQKYEMGYGQSDTWDDIISQLADRSRETAADIVWYGMVWECIERRLRRVREKVLGHVPKVRDDFDANILINKLDSDPNI